MASDEDRLRMMQMEMELHQYRRQQRDRELTHPYRREPLQEYLRREAAAEFGVPLSQVDLTQPAAGIGQRYGAGFFSDNPAEEAAFYGKNLPGRTAQIGEYPMTLTPEGIVRPANLPGLDRGDFAQLGGAATLPIIAGAVSGATRSGVTGTMASQVLAEAVREGLQLGFGTQRESWGPIAARLGLAAGGEALFPAIAKVSGNLKTALMKDRIPLEGLSEEDVAAAIPLATQGFDVPALMMYQDWESPVMQRLSSQIRQLSDAHRPKVIAQLQGLRNAYEQAVGGALPKETLPPGLIGPPQALSPDWAAQQSMARRYERQRAGLVPQPETAEAGIALQGQVQAAMDVRKQSMREGYAQVDELVGRYSPTYDLSAAKQSARQRRVEALPLLTEEEELLETAAQNPRQFVNVADPSRRLARINAVMAEIEPQQNYDVVRELRTQVGQILDMPYLKRMESGVDIGQAKEVYRDLSSALENPQGVPPDVAGTIQAATQQANARALNYYDSYDQTQIAQVLRSRETQTPVGMFTGLAENPRSWEPEFRRILDEGTDQERLALRENLDSMVLSSGDPVQTLRNWQRDDVAAYRWLYPTEQARRNALQSGRAINELNTTLSKQAYDQLEERRGFARYALEERLQRVRPNENPTQAVSRLVAENGGRNSIEHQAFRAAAIESALEDSIKRNPQYETFGVEPKAYAEGIEKLKANGWWDGLLTQKDRDILTRLGKLSEKIWETGDAGTALTLAGQIGQLRGSQGLSGMAEAAGSIRVSQALSHLITMPGSPKDVLLSYLGSSKARLGEGRIARGLTWANRALRSTYTGEEATQTEETP